MIADIGNGLYKAKKEFFIALNLTLPMYKTKVAAIRVTYSIGMVFTGLIIKKSSNTSLFVISEVLSNIFLMAYVLFYLPF